MSERSKHPEAAEINRIAKLLTDAWAKAEPQHGVTLHPVSYVATFVDMARAVVEDRGRQPVQTACIYCGEQMIGDGSYCSESCWLAAEGR